MVLGPRRGLDLPVAGRLVLVGSAWDAYVMKDLRCVLGRHTGQKEGGTLMFTCRRCKGSFWQRADFSDVQVLCDKLIAQGHGREALRVAQDEVRRRA